MPSVALFAPRRSAVWTRWGWTPWMLLVFMLSGAFSLVTVHQPPVLAAALSRDVAMPCELRLSKGDRFMTTPVLYWLTVPENVRLWKPTGAYAGRVHLLNSSDESLDKSLLLKKVQWADSMTYNCKVSIRTKQEGSTRKIGNNSTLMIYDSVVFNLTSPRDCLLRCEVNVSQKSSFALSIIHDGHKLQTATSAAADGASGLPYVTLSLTVSLRDAGEYECQLQLGGHVVTKSIFSFSLADAEGAANTEKSPNMCSLNVSEMVYPEPWPLYIALLLVSAIALLSLVMAMLMRR